ncbi:MAG: hypothetical protein WD533_07675 [Dehalococcoidia bacterium]
MAAPANPPRRRKNPGRTIGIIAVVGIVALAAIVMMSTFGGDARPAQQQRVMVPGAGEHLVNLWTEPEGGNGYRLTAQVADSGGWPAVPQTLTFQVNGVGASGSVEAPGAYSAEGPGRGQVFTATVEMPGQAPWDVRVRFSMNGNEADAAFAVE